MVDSTRDPETDLDPRPMTPRPSPHARLPPAARASSAARSTPLLAAVILGACGPSAPPPSPEPTVDASQVARILRSETRLVEPSLILFRWSLREQEVRVSGRGVARVEPPYRARLDLFLDNGETVARAALVDDELRIPPGMPDGIIPPPHLLWGTLGVFRPGTGAALLGATEEGDHTVLRYGIGPGQEVHYRLRDRRIHSVELLEGGKVVQRVSVEPGEPSELYPAEATYRNLSAFRELKLDRQSVEVVEGYPPDIWIPGA